MAQVAYVAAELRLADHLAGGAMQVAQLAKATGCHEPSLHRLLRALTAIGLCVELDDGSFAMSEAGRLLDSGSDKTLRSWILWFGRHQWSVWGQLLHTIKTGESARKRMTGSEGLELFDRSTETASLFNAAMVQLTRLVATEVARVCDLSEVRNAVDVGGGHGALLQVLLRENRHLRGILFDRPHAMAGAWDLLQKDVGDRCECVPGDFFAEVPRGYDLYVLKNIIHDWDDERALVVLQNCRDALRPDSRLLIIERILPPRLAPCASHRAVAHADLTMLIGPGGRERTRSEYEALVNAAGLELLDIKPIASGFSILESRARSSCAKKRALHSTPASTSRFPRAP